MVNPATPSITHHQLLSLGIISAVGIYWNKTSLAAYYSVQACEFASSRECLEIYAGLYAEGLGKHLTCGLEVKKRAHMLCICCVFTYFTGGKDPIHRIWAFGLSDLDF